MPKRTPDMMKHPSNPLISVPVAALGLVCAATVLGGCSDDTTAAAGGAGATGGGSGAAGGGGSAAAGGQGGAPAVPFLTDVTCTDPGPSGNGIETGTALHKVTLDAYPDALCNDGSPAVMYVRAAADAANQGRWMFHFQGGGSCNADFDACQNRWCSAQDGPGQQRSKMTSTLAPEVMVDKGIWLRQPANLLGAANQVFMYYCSSDSWVGRASDVVLENPADASDRFRLHFRGHDITTAVFDALRGGAVVSDDGLETMPDLDTAIDVLVTGTSAGSGGVTHNGDFLAGQFDPAVNVWLLFDASLIADVADITDATAAAANVQAQMDGFAENAVLTPFRDESCLAAHPPDEDWMCGSNTHVRLNHITTPFYQRMDLIDGTSISPYTPLGLTAMDVGPWNRATALRLPDIQTQGEEGAMLARAPAIYGPLCAQHVGITNSAYYGTATLEDANGLPWTVHDSLISFLAGNDFAAVDDGAAPPGSVCPPTNGAFD